MATAEDFYTIELSNQHLNWGTVRDTGSRERIEGESYIPIPRSFAERFDIRNSNGLNGLNRDTLGINLFNARSADGYYEGIIKSQGASKAGDVFAKQFSEQGNLKGFNEWFTQMNVTGGDQIKVEWINQTDILLTIIR